MTNSLSILSFFTGCGCGGGRTVRVWQCVQDDADWRGSEDAIAEEHEHVGQAAVFLLTLHHRWVVVRCMVFSALIRTLLTAIPEEGPTVIVKTRCTGPKWTVCVQNNLSMKPLSIIIITDDWKNLVPQLKVHCTVHVDWITNVQYCMCVWPNVMYS